MKKIVFVFAAVFCINSLTFSQGELKYFKEDNTFHLGGVRLSDSEVRQTLRRDISALEAWGKGNAFKDANKGLKIATGVLIGVGGLTTIISFGGMLVLLPFWWAGVDFTGVSVGFTAGLVLMGAGIVTGIMIPVTKVKYRDCYSEAASIYNKGLYKTSVSLHIGTTGNGLGFSLKS